MISLSGRTNAFAWAAALTCLALPAQAADHYEIDPAHSVLIFRVNHLGFSDFYGRFNDISGSFTVDRQNPSAGSIKLEVKADSVDTANDKRDQHLKSPDFLDAKQFPVIRFESTGVEAGKDGTLRVTGKLSFHGATHPVTAEVTRHRAGKDPWGNHRTGFNARFTVRRADYGVNYMPEGIGAEVELWLAIEGLRK